MMFTKNELMSIDQIIEAGTYSGKIVKQIAALKIKVEDAVQAAGNPAPPALAEVAERSPGKSKSSN